MPEINKKLEEMLCKYSEVQILRAIVNSYKVINDLEPGKNNQAMNIPTVSAPELSTTDLDKEPEPVATSDHQPCIECGGSFFLRTGTCHVCQTCGSSQGCS